MKLKIVLIYSILVFNTVLYSTNNSSVSGNNRFLAVNKYDKNKQKNIINIYDIHTKTWLHSLELKNPLDKEIEEVKISYDGKSLYARINKNYTIWNLQSGTVVCELNSVDKIIFTYKETFFLVYKSGTLEAFNCFTGNKVRAYKVPRSKINNIFISPLDKFIVAKTDDNNIIIWRPLYSDIYKVYKSKHINFNKNGRLFSVIRKENNTTIIESFTAPSLKKVQKIYCDKLITQKSKKKEKIVIEKSGFDKHARFAAITTIDKSNNTNVYIIDIKKGNILDVIKSKSFSQKINMFPFYFVKNNVIILKANDLSAAAFNFSSKKFVKALYYEFKFRFREKKIKVEKQIEQFIVSDNRKFISLQYSKKEKNILYLKHAYSPEEKYKFNNTEFLSFSNDNKYIFIRQKDKIGIIRTSEIDRFRNKPRILYMEDRLWKPQKEKVVEKDAKAPKGYKYIPIKKFRHVSTLTDESILKLKIKTVELDGDSTGIQVHLIDTNGVYYYGADKRAWRHIWKNLKLKSPSGKFSNITDFKVSETRDNNDIPINMSIIMDHSGSMGTDRCLILQNAVESFMKHKKTSDALAVVKYDYRTRVDVKLNKNLGYLLSNLGKIGDKEFGSSTSMLDATNLGTSLLLGTDLAHKRNVILVTDGQENSSFTPKNRVIINALKNNVNITTIGFGKNISEYYLKTLAYNTQGSFYHIYNRKDFNWLLDDIYKKMRNYYTIRFKTTETGRFTSLIEIGNKKSTDTLITVFDRKKIDLDEVDDYDNKIFNISIATKEYKKLSRSDKKKFNYLKKKEKKKASVDILKEFSKLKFPDIKFIFNKTIIVKKTDKELINVVKFMRKYPFINVEIQGHTDDVGENIDNQDLSERRAKKVRSVMIRRYKIKGKRLRAVGFGEKRSIATNKTKKGRSLNRRVEFHIINK